MKKILLMLIALLLVSCSNNSSNELTLTEVKANSDVTILQDPVDIDLIESMWKFSDKFELLKTDENSVLSPVSIYSALSMLIPASGSTTKEELLNYLEISEDADLLSFFKKLNIMTKDFSSLLTNSIWIHDENQALIDEEIVNTLAQKYLASSHAINFRNSENSSKVISDFINEQTNGFLDVKLNLEESLDLLLLNTIYFKDSWQNEFLENGPIEFENIGQVNSVISTISWPKYYEDDNLQMVTKEFKNNNSILFIKPKDSIESIDSYVDVFNKLKDLEYESNLEVNLIMPEVDISSKYTDVNEVLKANGLNELMSETPDLSFYNDPNLSNVITQIIHEARIVVDKTGAEAAAYTSIGLETTSAEPIEKRKIDLVLDKPYIMVLLSQDQAPLFIVNVIDPTK